MNLKVKEIILVGMFAALTAVGAFIKIPIPYVPFTLQMLFVLFAGSLLGSKLGFLSQLVYILTGLIGIPIFAHGGGPSYIFRHTFGYLIGFALGAYIIGFLVEKMEEENFSNYLIANLAGLIIVYIIGVAYLYLNLNFIAGKSFGIMKAIKIGFLVPVPGDLLLCVIAATISQKILSQVKTALPVTFNN
ncbi:biotin transporter BioY [Halanaerocella petrolearia]